MTQGSREPFLKWPGWNHIKLAALVSLAGSIWFLIIYGGCDAITAHRAARVRISFDWELRIPLIPAMTLFYMSIYALFVAAPFILRERKEFLNLSLRLNLAIFIAGIFFLLVPARLAFLPPQTVGFFGPLLRAADQLNLDYNLFPSLHVALSVICISTFASRGQPFTRLALWAWAIAISLSTVLTHQHHLLDVIGGWILALLAQRIQGAFFVDGSVATLRTRLFRLSAM